MTASPPLYAKNEVSTIHRHAGGSSMSHDLVPIGVFWDIENCSIPHGKSALVLVQRIREKLFEGHKEVEFMCVCDIRKQRRDVLEELNSGQVTIVHINATSKNAADDKLRQSLRRFAGTYSPPATVVLISGDIHFTGDLSDLRHRHNLCTILIHPVNVHCALLATAHQKVAFSDLCADLPERNEQSWQGGVEVMISGLPAHFSVNAVKRRLTLLSANCGGRVLGIDGPSALIRFSNADTATRAKKRMEGEDVFGWKIRMELPDTCPKSSPAQRCKKYVGSSALSRQIASDEQQQSEGATEKSKVLLKPWKDVPEMASEHMAKMYDNKADMAREHPEINYPSEQQNLLEPTANGQNGNVTPEKLYKSHSFKFRLPSPTKATAYQTTYQTHDSTGASHSPCRQLNFNSSPPCSPSQGFRQSPTQLRYGSGFQYHQYHTSHLDSSLVSHRLSMERNHSRDGSLDRLSTGSDGSISGESQLGLRDVAERFSPSLRSMALAQQQLHNDQERHHSVSSCRSWPVCASDWGCGDTSPLPWQLHSPSPSPQYEAPRYTPNFRRTPGAKRPTARSNGINSGGQRGSAFSFYSSPVFSCRVVEDFGGEGLPHRSRTPSPLLSMADLGALSGDEMHGGSTMELMVSNLDYNISAREWKKILCAEFQQQVQVLGVRIQTQPDNTSIGFVRVPNIDEARYAISQFHRKKIGYKRIHVTLLNQDFGTDHANLRSEVVGLLREVTDHRLPLFKFIELFEKRYHRTMTVSELYRMRDTVEIEDQDSTGRMVVLIGSGSSSRFSSPCPQHIFEELECMMEEEHVESPVCPIHCEKDSASYVDALDANSLPSIQLSLRQFAPQVHTLLQGHDGEMPLMSFPCCYDAEFGAFRVVEDGVLLEHLITCVPGVKIALSKFGIKKVQWAENKPPPTVEFGRICTSPMINQQLAQFAREAVDLLKQCPQCRMPFSKYIPAYHHHFGRQCRVADYGFTKLVELFESIPHVVQVVGGGSRRLIMLAHRAQVKRFISDIQRVLKGQATRQISVLDLPIVYNKVIGRPFNVTDYGVCYIEDMLNDVPETTFLVTGSGEAMVISVPRRDQTPMEIERTKQFCLEVIDLMKHSPQCRMPFSKFIPAYHHHFGKQCRVADYGFTKLLELFESIPHVLQLIEEQEEKTLCLTQAELLRVLEEQVATLLKSCKGSELPVQDFLASYMKFNGHSLRLPDFGVSSVMELIEKIPRVAKTDSRDGKFIITLVDHSYIQEVAHRILLLLMDQPEGCMGVEPLVTSYQELFGVELNIAEIAENLREVIKISEPTAAGVISLRPLQMFARDTRTLLRLHQGKLSLSQFETAYAQHFGVGLVPASYGYPGLTALLQAIPHVATMRGKAYRRMVLLCQDFRGKLAHMVPARTGGSVNTSGCQDTNTSTPSNHSGITELRDYDEDKEPALGKSPFEALVGSIPSNVPSPELRPIAALSESLEDLVPFNPEPALPPLEDMLTSLSPEERSAQKTFVYEMINAAASFHPIHPPPVLPSTQHVTQVHAELCESPVQESTCSTLEMSNTESPFTKEPLVYSKEQAHSTSEMRASPQRTGKKKGTGQPAASAAAWCSLTSSPTVGTPSMPRRSRIAAKFENDSPSPSPRTPTRRSRLAAKFDIPLSPSLPNVSA